MLTITLAPELEKAVAEEAAQRGTTAELLTLDVLQERFLRPSADRRLPEGATLATALADYIGAISTREKYPEGSLGSEDAGRKFAKLMTEKRQRGEL